MVTREGCIFEGIYEYGMKEGQGKHIHANGDVQKVATVEGKTWSWQVHICKW